MGTSERRSRPRAHTRADVDDPPKNSIAAPSSANRVGHLLSQADTFDAASASDAGDASATIKLATKSGRRAANRKAVWPPSDCPITLAGPPTSSSIHISASRTKALRDT